MTEFTEKLLLEAGGKSSQSVATLALYSDAEKNKRARKAFFLFLALGFFSVFLPLAHFFLVPGFLLASPWAYRWAKKQKGLLQKLEGSCPFCTKSVQHSGGGLEWPLRFVCSHCHEPIRASLLENNKA